MKIYLRNAIVALMAFLGGLSDFNSFDVPYYWYIILFVVYAGFSVLKQAYKNQLNNA
jgi:hypothetical protein